MHTAILNECECGTIDDRVQRKWYTVEEQSKIASIAKSQT